MGYTGGTMDTLIHYVGLAAGIGFVLWILSMRGDSKKKDTGTSDPKTGT